MGQQFNLVPYEVTVNAINLSSGHPISNILYRKDFTDRGGGYGAPVAGSDELTFLTSMMSQWTIGANSPLTALSDQYQMVSMRSRAIIGWKYGTPFITITFLAFTLTDTHVSTATPHGLSVGDVAVISGTITPAGIRGSWVVTAVPNPTTFVIGFVGTGPVTGSAQVQKVDGSPDFLYGSNIELTDTTIGAVASDQMPLYSTISMRRLNEGVGKNWRSRISLSPIGEADQKNGRLTVAALAIWTTVGNWITNDVSGGAPTQYSPAAVSKKLALTLPTPFTSSDVWCKLVTSHVPRTNLGSLTKRKPRLTSAINP